MRAVGLSCMLFLLSFVFFLLAFTLIFTPAQAADVAVVGNLDVMASLQVMVPGWLQVASLVVTIASSIAALTPSPKDDGVMRILRNVIDFLALNVGGASNKK